MLLILAVLLVILAIAGGIAVSPLLFALIIVAIVLLVMNGRSGRVA